MARSAGAGGKAGFAAIEGTTGLAGSVTNCSALEISVLCGPIALGTLLDQEDSLPIHELEWRFRKRFIFFHRQVLQSRTQRSS
jgi:hypothetical protein